MSFRLVTNPMTSNDLQRMKRVIFGIFAQLLSILAAHRT